MINWYMNLHPVLLTVIGFIAGGIICPVIVNVISHIIYKKLDDDDKIGQIERMVLRHKRRGFIGGILTGFILSSVMYLALNSRADKKQTLLKTNNLKPVPEPAIVSSGEDSIGEETDKHQLINELNHKAENNVQTIKT